MAATASKSFKGKVSFMFIWAIENGSALHASEYLESPMFVVQSIQNTKWQLIIIKDNSRKTMNFVLQRQGENEPHSIEIEFEISVLAADGSPLKIKTSKQESKGPYVLELFQNTNEVFFQRSSEFLPNDTLTIRCRMWKAGTEISKSDMCYARTRLGVDRRCFIWAIREFSSLRPEQNRKYCLEPTSNGSPQLTLSLFLSKRCNTNYVNIQIAPNFATREFYMFCKLSLLDSDGRVVHWEEIHDMFEEDMQKAFVFNEFFEKDKLMTDKSCFLQNDILSFRCEFLIEAEPVWSRIENYRYLNLEDEQEEISAICCPFKKAFDDLYRDKSLGDVFLRAGTTSLAAHKHVLISRSPVFKTMFTQDRRLKTIKSVDIPDFNCDTLERLLLYIYKDTIRELQWGSALDLFRAADKYQLLDLRKKCSFFLKSNLSATNVFSIISLADLHKDDDLREAAEDFILEHKFEILDSDTWKNFKRENLPLALEITESIIYLTSRNKRNKHRIVTVNRHHCRKIRLY